MSLALVLKRSDAWTSGLAAIVGTLILSAIVLWRDGFGPMFLAGLLFVAVLYWALATLIVYAVRKLVLKRV